MDDRRPGRERARFARVGDGRRPRGSAPNSPVSRAGRAPRWSRRLLAIGLATLGWLSGAVAPAAAHNTSRLGGGTVSFPAVVVSIAGVSVATGVVAVWSRGRGSVPGLSSSVEGLVGVLFVGLGGAAVGSVFLDTPAAALAGGTVGGVVGTGLLSYQTGTTGPTLAVGSIVIHRVVEGATLAAFWTAGATVTALAVPVLTAHAAVECVSIGIHPAFTRREALGAVLVVTFGFALGLAGGAVGLSVIERVPTQWVLATVGGLLITVGIADVRTTLGH